MQNDNEELWYQFLVKGNKMGDGVRAIFDFLPHDPRCHFCHSPFEGFGGKISKLVGRGQSREDPRFCDACVNFGYENPGGTHIDLAMYFADIRGSTPLAERIGDREFSRLIDRFFQISASSIIKAGGLIDRLAGDQAIGYFVPGLAGLNYPQRALESAKELLIATGHKDQEGPWIPVGVGLHAGNAFVGMVGATKGVTNLTALGDDINIGARIASVAGTGELLASINFCKWANLEVNTFEHREVSLKGKQTPMEVVVIPLD